MTVNTTGIQTSVNCANPASSSLRTPGGGANYTISATSDQQCAASVTFNPSTAEQQYGVIPIGDCGTTGLSVSQQGVMFWYFHLRQDGTPEAQSVFCQPKIGIFNILATADLNNGSLVNVTVIDPYTPSNNVTGSPLDGQAFNGYVVAFLEIFNPSPIYSQRQSYF
jgi:hypothetical protein